MRKYRLGKSVLYNTKKSTNLKRMPNFYNIKYLDPRLFLKEWHVDGFADRMVSRSLLLLATLILWPRSLLFVATVFLYPRFLLFLLFLYSPAPPIKSFKIFSCDRIEVQYNQRRVLQQNSLVSMTHPFYFFSPPILLGAEKRRKGWDMDTSEFCLTLRAHFKRQLVLMHHKVTHYVRYFYCIVSFYPSLQEKRYREIREMKLHNITISILSIYMIISSVAGIEDTNFCTPQ